MSEHLRRGNKLWESNRMFLPGHKQALLNRKCKQKEFQQPDLDEDQFEKLNLVILEAIEYDRLITITYSAVYGPIQFWGRIAKINQFEKWLKIMDDEKNIILTFKEILDVELA